MNFPAIQIFFFLWGCRKGGGGVTANCSISEISTKWKKKKRKCFNLIESFIAFVTWKLLDWIFEVLMFCCAGFDWYSGKDKQEWLSSAVSDQTSGGGDGQLWHDCPRQWWQCSAGERERERERCGDGGEQWLMNECLRLLWRQFSAGERESQIRFIIWDISISILFSHCSFTMVKMDWMFQRLVFCLPNNSLFWLTMLKKVILEKPLTRKSQRGWKR